ncbi:carboxypeptidase [Actinorhabdospora filicis]|uniref:Carboxypeptidase n=1 Tax=Actinorhabdospora filicis TaxID=1785913 RepID=A0A9W6WD15_9ACTN|nr:transglycosylase domain-containing protein [Actinorhabdospora filicis]GLZ80375.1 carboxypeptidase [Actinorhabdospora filicis]
MPRDRSLLNNVTSLLVCGLLAGLVVAAAAFPAVAVSGLAAKAGAESFDDLPDELKVEPIPLLTEVLANDGKTLITSFYDESRVNVNSEDVPQVMKDAIIAVEDSRFYQHNGVDPHGVVRALLANSAGGQVQEGASTLTMQYVRNVLKYNAKTDEEIFEATEDTPARKIREMRYAMAIEKELSKDEILSRYLNIAFFGNRAYGIHAAARAYFSKDPKDLTIGEAALIAGLVQAPGAYDPSKEDKTEALTRRDHVLDRMVETKKITKEQADEARNTPLEFKLNPPPSECVEVPQKYNDWGFFCDFLKDWWKKNPAFGSSETERLARLKQGGYKIVTSLDPDLQATAMKAILRDEDKSNHRVLGTVVIEPGTGRVRSMAVNRTYSLDTSKNGPHSDPRLAAKGFKGTYPNTTVPLFTSNDDGVGGYQIGSTAKMFTMVTALEQGMPLNTTFNNKSPYASFKYGAGYDPKGSGTCGQKLPSGEYKWCPKNDNPKWMDIRANMWQGFGRSINTYFAQLIDRLGAEKVIRTWEKMGITWHNNVDKEHATPGCQNLKDFEGNTLQCQEPGTWGSITLGTAATTPMEVANAYATLGAEGKYCKPTPIQELYDRDGNKVAAGDPECQQVISQDVARATTDAARCPVMSNSSTSKCNGGTFSGPLSLPGNRDVAGKTGTTDNGSLWFAGFTPNAALATFHTDPDYVPKEFYVPTAPHYDVSEKILSAAVKDLPEAKFKTPSEQMIVGKDPTDVPSVNCDSVEDATAKMTNRGFKVEVVNGDLSNCPTGTIYAASPGDRAPKGSTIQLLKSSGERPKNPPASGDPDNPGDDDDDGPNLPDCGTWFCPPPNDNNGPGNGHGHG